MAIYILPQRQWKEISIAGDQNPDDTYFTLTLHFTHISTVLNMLREKIKSYTCLLGKLSLLRAEIHYRHSSVNINEAIASEVCTGR